VQEVGGEHHVVARVPEFRVVLCVEVINVTSTDESESTGDANCAEEVNEETGVVQWAVGVTSETGQNSSHHCHLLVRHHPEVVGYTEQSEGRVRGVLAGS